MAITPHELYGLPLSCPAEFAKASREVIDAVANGCGDGWRDKLVPDTMYGLSVKPACEIHDWEYHFGKTNEDKDRADRRFLNNLLRLIEWRSANVVMRALRNRRALKYYEAVRQFGGPAFWLGKE